MNPPPEREATVFNAARKLPPEERAHYLEGACAGDAGLRQRVEELLQANEAAAGFLPELSTATHETAEKAAPSGQGVTLHVAAALGLGAFCTFLRVT